MSLGVRSCVSALSCAALWCALAGCTAVSAIDPSIFLKNIIVKDVSLASLPDNTYEGQYTIAMPPGQYAMNRHFDMLVQVKSGAYYALTIKDPSTLDSDADFVAFKDRIISGQTLQVDGVSGATYSSKAMLKAIEAAVTR